MVLEINMGVCPRFDFENIMLFDCLGYTLLIYDVMNDITIIPKGTQL